MLRTPCIAAMLIAVLTVELVACFTPIDSIRPLAPSASSNPSSVLPDPPSLTGKKLIEVGYASPSVQFVAQNISAMQQRPLDGIVINLNPAGDEGAPWLLDPRVWPESNVPFSLLERINWGRFTDNFLRLNTVHGYQTPDWFDDARWQQITANVRLLVRAAQAAQAKGVMFDPEPYGLNPWVFRATDFPGKTFAQVQAQVKRRGAQFMQAVQTEFADVRILMMFGLSIVRDQVEAVGNLEQADWGLWGSFIDGMLSVVGPKVELIDGNEGAYYHTTAREFDDFRANMQGSRELVSVENRAKYDAQFKVAHAVYVDGLLNLWQSPRFFGYYLANDTERRQLLEHNVYHALRASDRYVWVYNENMDFWGTKGHGVTIPDGLELILAQAAGKIARNEPLGFDITAAVARARQEYDRRIFVYGRIMPNGTDISGVVVRSGPPVGLENEDPACNTAMVEPDHWSYDCTFPYGWTGTVKPVLEGRVFKPVQVTLTNQTESLEDQDFQAVP
ncbi:MAG: hypothetical protein N2385_01940 [Chloroflexus sp.]|nr:hypothetical protein [Chloroflexus sp.]